MNPIRRRPLSVGPIRAFEAVARHLSFRVAADELALTQSAVSRQIQALEDDLGAPLFSRGTRRVELTHAGIALLRAVAPGLERLDTAVRQIRQARGRRVVGVTTFASFASLWLIPRLAQFQREHPQIDIRISASDTIVEPDGGEATGVDVALRQCRPEAAPPGAVRLFDELIAPVASPWLLDRARRDGPPLAQPADLTGHTLMEEDNPYASAEHHNWPRWLHEQGLDALEPARWLYTNYTHQQVQAAIAGQGIALCRLPMSFDALARGELVELFPERRLKSPYAYWLVKPPLPTLPEDVQRFCDWIEAQAALTREAVAGEHGGGAVSIQS
jgi:LysR family transcriptional regulator, glycine cleavage system transcriptional activator